MAKIGISLEPFLPIIHATMKNIENKGPLMSLTMPVIRGDGKTILAHLSSITDMDLHTDVYKVISRVALKMATKRATLDEAVAAINLEDTR